MWLSIITMNLKSFLIYDELEWFCESKFHSQFFELINKTKVKLPILSPKKSNNIYRQDQSFYSTKVALYGTYGLVSKTK